MDIRCEVANRVGNMRLIIVLAFCLLAGVAHAGYLSRGWSAPRSHGWSAGWSQPVVVRRVSAWPSSGWSSGWASPRISSGWSSGWSSPRVVRVRPAYSGWTSGGGWSSGWW